MQVLKVFSIELFDMVKNRLRQRMFTWQERMIVLASNFARNSNFPHLLLASCDLHCFVALRSVQEGVALPEA